jgi:S1-C subfamily serine protease
MTGGSVAPATVAAVPRHGSVPARRRRRLVTAALVAAVAVASAGSTYLLTRKTEASAPASQVTPVVDTAGSGSATDPTAAMLDQVLPSVVNVRVTQAVFDPFGGQQEQSAEGSGVIVSTDGLIVTNAHVVEDATNVEVEFTDGREPLDATVLGVDSSRDLAVIDVDADDLTPITVGDSSSLQLGDEVFAIGFPLDLGPTVTGGIVSGTDRSVEVQDGPAIRRLSGLLQTDAAINPGNSGGALVNEAGELVGIPTVAAQASAAENVGFAISVDSAIAFVRQVTS